MIERLVYVLCALTSMLCAGLLYRHHRRVSASLLLWSTWCFVLLAVSNVLLFLDFVVFPAVDLSILRAAVTLAGLLLLLGGLVRERTG